MIELDFYFFSLPIFISFSIGFPLPFPFLIFSNWFSSPSTYRSFTSFSLTFYPYSLSFFLHYLPYAFSLPFTLFPFHFPLLPSLPFSPFYPFSPFHFPFPIPFPFSFPLSLLNLFSFANSLIISPYKGRGEGALYTPSSLFRITIYFGLFSERYLLLVSYQLLEDFFSLIVDIPDPFFCIWIE